MNPSASFLPREPRTAPLRVLVAVLYRQAGLIALCALVGAAASLGLHLRQPRARVSTAAVRADGAAAGPGQAGEAAGTPEGPLKRELDAGLAASAGGAADEHSPSRAQTLALRIDQLDAYLRLKPPAAGRRAIVDAPDPAAAIAHSRTKIADGMGPVVGLLLGLTLGARRELGGGRMRSTREAEWALGTPVLGAIPTLSAKGLDACFRPPTGARNA